MLILALVLTGAGLAFGLAFDALAHGERCRSSASAIPEAQPVPVASPQGSRTARSTPRVRVLFVCTGNTFRSPMAQAFVARAAHDEGLDLIVETAGTLKIHRAVSSRAATICAQAGIEISGHRRRVLKRKDIERSELILGMAREHVGAVVMVEPRAWERSFTLKEFVRRGEMLPPAPGQILPEWLEMLGADRRRADLMGWSTEDDVLDPIGASTERMQATRAEISQLVNRMLKLLEPYTLSRSHKPVAIRSRENVADRIVGEAKRVGLIPSFGDGHPISAASRITTTVNGPSGIAVTPPASQAPQPTR